MSYITHPSLTFEPDARILDIHSWRSRLLGIQILYIHVSPGRETQTPQLEIQTAAREAEHAGAFGDVATTPIERRPDHIPFDLLDG